MLYCITTLARLVVMLIVFLTALLGLGLSGDIGLLFVYSSNMLAVLLQTTLCDTSAYKSCCFGQRMPCLFHHNLL